VQVEECSILDIEAKYILKDLAQLGL